MSKKNFFNKYALTGVLLAMSVGAWAQETQQYYYLQVNYIDVNEWNRNDVLDTTDSLGYATVIFDGDSTLILHDAEISNVSWEEINGKGLRVHLIGNNYNVNDGDLFQGPTKADILPTLTFTTDANRPGALWLGYYESLCDLNFGEVFYKDGLDYVSNYPEGEDATYSVSCTVRPLLDRGYDGSDGDDEPDPIEVTFEEEDFFDDDGDEIDLSNTVIDGILYTMSNLETDGFDEGSIVFGTSMTEAEVEEAMQYLPGSFEFAYAFTGATFKVPAGTGLIKINVMIEEGGIMMVKIGNNSPMAITAMEGEVEIPYVCAEPAFVYVYNGTPPVESEARMIDKFREKKVTIVVRMSSVSVEPDVVQEQAAPDVNPRVENVLDAFTLTGDIVRIDDPGITSLADGLFKGVKARFFDLSKTSIVGMNVSRARGAFEDVPEEAFIYMPVGNTADEGEPNVVIGEICENMQLQGNSDDPEMGFEAGMDFSANVTLDRDFTVGQTSTIYLPFAVGKNEAAAIGQFFTFKGIDSKGDAELEEVLDGLEANTPYIYRKTDDAQPAQFANVRVKQMPTEPVTAELIGTFEYKEFTAEEVSDYLYGYAAVDDTDAGIVAGEFVRIAAGAFIKPFRAYLKLEGDAGARINVKWGDEGEATGISDLSENEKGKMITEKRGGMYDLQGREINSQFSNLKSQIKKGLYIQNGQKFIVK